MSGHTTIKIKLMGKLLFCTDANEQWKGLDTVSEKAGKKQTAFFLYLLLNHGRKVTYEELIQQFWSNDGKDPDNALRNTLHKTRKMLRAMFPECKELLLTQDGGLVWNEDEANLELDVEELERLYNRFKTSKEEGDRIQEGLKACEIYNGEILPGSTQVWLDRINIYYLNIYVDLCRTLANVLGEQGRWSDVVNLCQRAHSFAPEVEDIASAFMYSLIMEGKPELAIRHYEVYQKMLWEEFAMTPSERIEKIYGLATKHNDSDEYEKELIGQITHTDDLRQSFSCSLPIFRNLVNLEMRSMSRSKHHSSLVILRLGKSKPRDIQRMERVLLQGLRSGDSFTQLNADRFVLLLPGATEENAQKVIERILQVYGTLYPRANTTVKFRVYPIMVHTEGGRST